MDQIWVITEKCDGQLVYNKNAKLCDRLLGQSPSTLIQWQHSQGKRIFLLPRKVLFFYGRFPPKQLPKSTMSAPFGFVWKVRGFAWSIIILPYVYGHLMGIRRFQTQENHVYIYIYMVS